jgi:hypothetical protein
VVHGNAPFRVMTEDPIYSLAAKCIFSKVKRGWQKERHKVRGGSGNLLGLLGILPSSWTGDMYGEM